MPMKLLMKNIQGNTWFLCRGVVHGAYQNHDPDDAPCTIATTFMITTTKTVTISCVFSDEISVDGSGSVFGSVFGSEYEAIFLLEERACEVFVFCSCLFFFSTTYLHE